MQKAVALSLALITLFSWLKVSFRKDDLVRQRAHSVIDTEESTLWKLEKLWLEKYLPYKQSEYLALAEQIDKSIYLREKYKCAGSLSGKDFLELIFSNESKPRVLAMLLMSFASVITLSIRSGADINTVFKFYDNVSWEELAMIFLFFPIIFYVAFLEVKFVVVMLLLGLERVFERGGGRSAFSRRKTKIFINVLVRLFAFEKPRVKLTRK
ncbi:hypothetical protein [Pseudoalteromonas ardens]|nr:hypothetical protein [Pseudoalteromonas sp. R96]MDK1313827.1 hypothetical protein [Pseudoalteromonas sp. R96]